MLVPPPPQPTHHARHASRSRSRSPLPGRVSDGDADGGDDRSHRGGSPSTAGRRQAPPPGHGPDSLGQAAPPAAHHPRHRHHHLLHTAPLRFGAATARGARPYMEDRHVVVSPFHVADAPFGSGGGGGGGGGGAEEAEEGEGATAAAPAPTAAAVATLHQPHRDYCAIFDGHSGADAAEHAAARLHGLLARDPALRLCQGSGAAGAGDGDGDGDHPPPPADSDGGAGDGGPGPPTASPPPPGIDTDGLGSAVTAALRACFHAVDAEILARARSSGGREGATALVALRLGRDLFTAHAGDARAVLRRAGGVAHRLTTDHKPGDPGERARVLAAGGRVEHLGCWRVVSIPADPRRLPAGLAISRSLGDLDFKGEGGPGSTGAGVTADPTVGRVRLGPADDVLILASDGLWDVLSDQQACDIAGETIARVVAERRGGDGAAAPGGAAGTGTAAAAEDDGGLGVLDGLDEDEAAAGPRCVLEAAAAAAARALVAAALARRSMDNITALCAVMPWAHGGVES